MTSYYVRQHNFTPLTRVRAAQVNDELNAVQTSFALLPGATSGGFVGPLVVGTATGVTHALQYGQLQTLDTNIDAGSTYTINNLPLPASDGDAASKAYVLSAVSAGGDPSLIGITTLGVGSATANQVVVVNGAGTAIVGVAQSGINAGLLDGLARAAFALVAGSSGQDFNANNLIIAGLVDGRDIAADGATLDSHGVSPAKLHFLTNR